MTDEDRQIITERLQAAGFTAVQIEKLIPTIAEAIEIARQNDEDDSWVSSEELRQRLIERYGEQFKLQ